MKNKWEKSYLAFTLAQAHLLPFFCRLPPSQVRAGGGCRSLRRGRPPVSMLARPDELEREDKPPRARSHPLPLLIRPLCLSPLGRHWGELELELPVAPVPLRLV